MSRAAIVLGASGSVGGALLRTLFRDGSFDPIITLTRRSLPEAVALAKETGRTLREKLVPEMNPAALEAATREALSGIDGEAEAFSVLGIGANTAKITVDEHRAVDVALNEAFARAAKASGKVHHLALMTAAGANPNASPSGSGAAGMSRYNRVKGEAEEAVKTHGPTIVSVFRPGLIIGSQHTPKIAEKVIPLFGFITPGKFKSITVDQIARAMVATAKHHPPSSGVYHYPEMMEFIARDAAK
jgi:uncharacterized protein YbjT (DUF2867 family)